MAICEEIIFFTNFLITFCNDCYVKYLFLAPLISLIYF